ncbi:DUF3179 domain-containing protein [Roseospira navarrensis]|uniref:DUF3179 domain-containing protein n=2 Tax=Roseospira navarrensis TaxID=140058 RepID=A0A7X1ZGB6_9PROT|nr:DUF3179 domain-containing protein [Roseospira navarrensis]
MILGAIAVSIAVAGIAWGPAPLTGGADPLHPEARAADAPDVPVAWTREFPKTDFSRRAVALDEILSGGPSRDGIPAIDDPQVQPVDLVRAVRDREPVLVVDLNGDARAYPLQILIWHEIVNDTVGGVPVAVTYCPLCASGIVFERTVDGRELDFGTTGRLRKSDLVMYDRQTESWWQQFSGEAIIGGLTGTRLEMVPAGTMPMARFRATHPDGRVLVPADPDLRRYGANPYAGYDTAARPMLYDGEMPPGIAPLARVVVVGDTAYSLDLIRDAGTVRVGDLVLRHVDDMASPLDRPRVSMGRDIGAVEVERVTGTGAREPARHHIAFAFAFHAFQPDGRIVTEPPR